jgi:hypothetical protein
MEMRPSSERLHGIWICFPTIDRKGIRGEVRRQRQGYHGVCACRNSDPTVWLPKKRPPSFVYRGWRRYSIPGRPEAHSRSKPVCREYASCAGEPTRRLGVGVGTVMVGVGGIPIAQDEVYFKARPPCGMNPGKGFCRDVIVSGRRFHGGPTQFVPDPAHTALATSALYHRLLI